MKGRNCIPTEQGGVIYRFNETLSSVEIRFLAAVKGLDPLKSQDNKVYWKAAHSILFKKRTKQVK